MQKLATSEQIFPIRASILESSSKGFELLKTYLAVSLWTQCFGDNKSNTIENTAGVRPSGFRFTPYFHLHRRLS